MAYNLAKDVSHSASPTRYSPGSPSWVDELFSYSTESLEQEFDTTQESQHTPARPSRPKLDVNRSRVKAWSDTPNHTPRRSTKSQLGNGVRSADGRPQALVVQGVMYDREHRFADCVGFCWCRPMGGQAKSQLAKARDLHQAGDLEGARLAVRCANIWSALGLATGLAILLIAITATYLLIFYFTHTTPS